MTTGPTPCPTSVDLVVPAYNEAADLHANISHLHRFLSESVGHRWQITIAENGSTDQTLKVAERLSAELPRIRVLHCDAAGRGGALRAAWTSTDAAIVAYMDADLSTDLASLEPLVDAIASDRADVAIGSRLAPGAVVTRAFGREYISQSYNHLVRLVLQASFSDAQCGFKALRTDVARRLLPHVVDQGWFFDTELLVIAQRAGLRVVEIPVTWVEDPDSTVKVLPTAWADLRGLARVARRRPHLV